MNRELMNLGYRVQRGKVNRQYFMEKYCYGKEFRSEEQKWELIKMKIKQYMVFQIQLCYLQRRKVNKEITQFCDKKEALAWEKEFLNGQARSAELTFREYFE